MRITLPKFLVAVVATSISVAAVDSSAFLKPKASIHVALSVRGGSDVAADAASGVASGVFGTPVTQEFLAKLFVGLFTFNSLVGMPSPKQFGKLFNEDIVEGTFEHVIVETLCSTSLGLAVATFLSTCKDVSAVKISSYGALACTYLAYKNLLNGAFDKFDNGNIIGPGMTAFMVVCQYLILSGTGDTELIAKIFSAPPLVYGLLGMINVDTGCKILGLPELSGPVRTWCYWLFNISAAYGVLMQSLLAGNDNFMSIGLSALVMFVGNIDNVFARKWNDALEMDSVSPYIFLLVPAVVAAGLLINQ